MINTCPDDSFVENNTLEMQILKSIQLLRSTERGVTVCLDLRQLLDGPARFLDYDGKMAVLTLTNAFFLGLGCHFVNDL